MESCQYLTGHSSPPTTTLLQDEGLDTSSLKRKSANWSRTSRETHWRENFKNAGGYSPSAKQDAVNSCSSNSTLRTLKQFSQEYLGIIPGNNWQEPSSLSRIADNSSHATRCFCSGSKRSGVLPWNAIELFDNVSEMLIAWVSFLPCFLIWLLTSLFLHSRYSFAMDCNAIW